MNSICSLAVQLEIKTEELNACALNPGGTSILTGSQHGDVPLWDVATGKCLNVFEGHSGPVWSFAWSADQQRFLSGSFDRTMRLWNIETGRLIRSFTRDENARSVAWSPDEQCAASASMRGIRVWSVETGECLSFLQGHTSGVYSIDWSPDQKRILSASTDGTMRLWEVETGRCLRTIHDQAHCVAWSRDGQRALSSGQSVRLWDMETGDCLRVFEEHPDGFGNVEWSPDQLFALAGSKHGPVKVWHIETGRCLYTLEGHMVGVISAKWSADQRRIFSCDWKGGIRLWDLSLPTS